MRVGSWALCFHRRLQGLKKGLAIWTEKVQANPFSFSARLRSPDCPAATGQTKLNRRCLDG